MKNATLWDVYIWRRYDYSWLQWHCTC
jgi:hypothetical protein